MNRGFANIAVIIVLVVIVGGAGWWYLNKSNIPATTTEQTTAQTSQTSPKMQVEHLSLTSQNKDVLPVVRYRVDVNVQGNGYIELVSKGSGESIWGMEQEPSGTHDLNLNVLTRLGDYSAIKVPEGDYFLRVSDKFADNTPDDRVVACTNVNECEAESATFHVTAGITRTFVKQSSITETANWKTYRNDKFGFELTYSSEYILTAAPNSPTTTFVEVFFDKPSFRFKFFAGTRETGGYLEGHEGVIWQKKISIDGRMEDEFLVKCSGNQVALSIGAKFVAETRFDRFASDCFDQSLTDTFVPQMEEIAKRLNYFE